MTKSNDTPATRTRVLRIHERVISHLSIVTDALRGQRQRPEAGLLARGTVSDLGAWLPRGADGQDRLWVVALPEAVRENLLELAQCPIEVVNRLTADKLYAVTFIEWRTLEMCVSTPCRGVTGVSPSSTAFIYILFVTTGRAVLVRTPEDENFMASLQCAEISTRENYKPYRIWSDEELEIAAVEASAGRSSDEKPYFRGEGGMILLYSFDYRDGRGIETRSPSLSEYLTSAGRA